eukprot:1154125-Pelagomonas_calceolata.AAC.6
MGRGFSTQQRGGKLWWPWRVGRVSNTAKRRKSVGAMVRGQMTRYLQRGSTCSMKPRQTTAKRGERAGKDQTGINL